MKLFNWLSVAVGQHAIHAIWWNGEQVPEEGTAPAGVGVSSFTAEATAAESALIKARERVMRGWRGRIRIMTDSRSLLDSLRTPARHQEQRVRAVSTILGETAAYCPCDLVWVPSHCGVTRNEHVDELAKQALSIPLDAQVRVPIDYADAKQRVKTSPVADKLIEQMPENLQVSTRKAEVILAQLYVGHTPKLHPVASYLNGTRCICPCRMGVTNDVEHYLLRCPDRSASRVRSYPHREIGQVWQYNRW